MDEREKTSIQLGRLRLFDLIVMVGNIDSGIRFTVKNNTVNSKRSISFQIIHMIFATLLTAIILVITINN